MKVLLSTVEHIRSGTGSPELVSNDIPVLWLFPRIVSQKRFGLVFNKFGSVQLRNENLADLRALKYELAAFLYASQCVCFEECFAVRNKRFFLFDNLFKYVLYHGALLLA